MAAGTCIVPKDGDEKHCKTTNIKVLVFIGFAVFPAQHLRKTHSYPQHVGVIYICDFVQGPETRRQVFPKSGGPKLGSEVFLSSVLGGSEGSAGGDL